MSKNGLHSKHICKNILAYLYSIDFTKNSISRVMPCSQKKDAWFYLHWLGSYKSNKVKNAYYILTYSFASFDMTQKMRYFLASGCLELSNDV